MGGLARRLDDDARGIEPGGHGAGRGQRVEQADDLGTEMRKDVHVSRGQWLLF